MANPIQNRIIHDEELIVRLQRGDEWAFQLLVRRFREKIFSVAFGITLDVQESREIVQDVFFLVYRRILDFSGDASLEAWLYRITVNHCRSWKRRWARRFQWFRRIGGGDKNGNGPAIGDLPESRRPAINAQTRQLIDQTLNQLSDQARMVFVLRELENLSYAEIAYVSGINSETVRSRLFHTRRQLRTLLASVKAEEGPK